MPRFTHSSISSTTFIADRARKFLPRWGRSQKVHRYGHPRLVNMVVIGLLLAMSELYLWMGVKCLAGKGKLSISSLSGLAPVLMTLPFSLKTNPGILLN